jgi:hypothetical protein
MKLIDSFFFLFMSGVPRFQHSLGNKNILAVLPIISLGLVIQRYRLPSKIVRHEDAKTSESLVKHLPPVLGCWLNVPLYPLKIDIKGLPHF